MCFVIASGSKARAVCSRTVIMGVIRACLRCGMLVAMSCHGVKYVIGSVLVRAGDQEQSSLQVWTVYSCYLADG